MTDYTVGDTFHHLFTTRAFATGVPTVLAGTPVVSAYEDLNLTQITAGVTLAVDHDSVVGLNSVVVVATGGNGFETGKTYHLVITTGTVGGVSVVGEVVGSFTLGRSAAAVDLANGTDGLGALKAETALIVADTGELQTDWADGGRLDLIQDIIAADTTTDIPALIATAQADLDIITGADGVNLLSATQASIDAIEVDTSTTIDTHLNDIKGATFSGATDSLEAVRNRGDSAWTGGATTSNNGTAQAGAAGSITLAAGASDTDNLYNGQVVNILSGTGAGQSRAIDVYTGNTKVATVITNWVTNPSSDSVYEVYPDDITEVTAAPTAAAVADAVWDENTSGHTTASTFGEQCKNDIDAILVDTGGLQTDWANGGRLDLILDIIAADTTTDIPAILGSPADTNLATDLVNINAQNQALAAQNAAILTDTETTIPATIATAQADLDIITGASGVNLLTATQASVDAIEADTGTDGVVLAADQGVDVTKVNGSASAASRLSASSLAVLMGTAQTGTLSTTQCTTNLTGFADDELIGRVITFYSGTAYGQSSDITDYANSSGLITFTAINTAPANSDGFIVT